MIDISKTLNGLLEPRFSLKERVHFTKRLSFLTGANIPILESLKIIQSQTRSKTKRSIHDRLILNVTNGMSLSGSMAQYEHFFGKFSIYLIKIGEMEGMLAENLLYLSQELRKKEELRKKVTSALVYPICITIATLVISSLLIMFIFPKITPIFQSLHADLPLSTVILLGFSKFLRSYFIYLILVSIVFAFCFYTFKRSHIGFKLFLDQTVLKVPFLGKIITNYTMANMCRTLGLLLQKNVNIVEAIRITGQTLENSAYQRELEHLAALTTKGERISDYFHEHAVLFPDTVAHLTAVGETSGNLSETLLYLSEIYENEVNDMTKNLSNSIEPTLMVSMGLIVGFIAVSVITPIYEVTQYLQPK